MLGFNIFSVFKILLVFLCSAYLLNAQENTQLKKVSEKLAIYKEEFSPEKVYLQTDKDYYTNSDTLWFKTYIVDGISHNTSDKSRVVYVELVDSKQNVIALRKIYAGFDGGSGDIALVENIEEGIYFLRAYTKYMLNDEEPVLFQKEIMIWTTAINSNKKSQKVSKKRREKEVITKEITAKLSSRPIVQFFPEGGNLVAGLNNVLGFKVTNEEGTGIALEGKIIDENGSLISMFSTYEFGLGRVQFKVEPNIDYFAEIEIEGKVAKYSIPKPMDKGYVLQISNRGEYFQIRVAANLVDGLNGLLLVGHLRGETFLEHLIENNLKDIYEIRLSTTELDDGVATFTLFTPNGEPVCERLVFIENPNKSIDLSVKTDVSNYGFRKKVNVDLTVVNEMGVPLSGNFSMSVVSQNALKNEAKTIKSWLLLNSDLGGTVENPNYFFEDDSKSRKNLLDILMLTHGWRRFVWNQLGTNQAGVKLLYPPEKGIIVNGKTVSLKNRQEPLKTSVSLTITEPSAYKEDALSDSQGKFSFGPMIFRDSINAAIKAVYDLDSKKEVAVYLEPSFPKIPIKDSLRNPVPPIKTIQSQAYIEEAYKKKVNDFEYDPKVVKLDEFIGTEKLKSKKELINEVLNERTMHGQALNRIIPDSIIDSEFNSVADLIQRNVAGVRVEGQYPNQKIRLRPVGSFRKPPKPLYLLDGIVVDPSMVLEMFGGEILFIDVLKNAGEIAQYGSRGASGVIAVYTPKGENYEFVQEKELNKSSFTLPGFYRARDFYSPNYSGVKIDSEKPDYRITLHWSPGINLSDVEQTNLTFYTGDTAGTYTIRVEGITDDGTPVGRLHNFTIEEE